MATERFSPTSSLCRRPARRAAHAAWRLTAIVALALLPLAAHAEPVAPAALLTQIDAGTAPPILDVRSASEFARDHVPGAHHAPFTDVTAHATRLQLDPRAPVVVYCEHGPRALLARTALGWAGFTDVRLLEGHMSGWRKQGLRVERATPIATPRD